MRINEPVSGHEYPLMPGVTLLSTTDLDSRVTYANEAFLEASGFSRSPLLGQPHNLVRHPDMPREAVADMWHTLRAGHAWSALVKNRRADGDHYWVRANATPVRREGRGGLHVGAHRARLGGDPRGRGDLPPLPARAGPGPEISAIRKSGLKRDQSSPASIMRMSVEMSAP